MRNAKEELSGLFIGSSFGNIVCARVECKSRNIGIIKLKKHHTKEEFLEFFDKLDFEYDAGFGGQELYGTIWCKDYEYYDRGEYDGSEWWEHHSYPTIPQELEDKIRERNIKLKTILDEEDNN